MTDDQLTDAWLAGERFAAHPELGQADQFRED